MIRNERVRAILIFLAAFLLFILYTTERYSGRSNVYFSPTPDLVLGDSVSHTDYLKMKAVTDRQDTWQKRRIGFQGLGHGFGIGPLRYWQAEECDTCQNYRNDGPGVTKHYLGIPGFYLNDEVIANSFFEEQHYYVANKNPRFKFNTEKPDEAGELLIPMTENGFNIMRIAGYIFTAIGIILVILILRPISVLINIANGRAFSEKNHRMLQLSGSIIIGILVLDQIVTLCILWRYHGSIPDGLEYPFWENLYEKRKGFIIGVALLLLAAAFKKGYELKEEQTLTV
jgi:hypothetical protein